MKYFIVWLSLVVGAGAEDLLTIETAGVKVGIDRDRGAAITWLSSKTYPKNIVNLADPGRLIQQSVYAGKSRDRQAEGQSSAWSPWTWNPIQGGGIGSWARVTEFEKVGGASTLHSETVPKLWDMPDEEAQAVMRQWTRFEPGLPGVIEVRCEFESMRATNDAWGVSGPRAQEIPACYFTRNFSDAKSYLGDGKWREESHPPGPPWGHATPPLNAMAFFEAGGQGVAVFSPCATQRWNFGPHGAGLSDESMDGPCMHVAPLDRVKLEHDSVYRYRYWLCLGDEKSLAQAIDALRKKYANEKAELTRRTAAK